MLLKQGTFVFLMVFLFRFYQYILYKAMNIPLSFYDTDNPLKLYVLEICILLSSITSLVLISDVFV